jgi:hypothetical protein
VAGSAKRPDPLRDALAQLAAAEAPELLAEARLAARTRARTLIEDALVEELLQAAATVRRESSGPTREPSAAAPTPAPQPPRDRESTGQAWWTYCILAAADRDVVQPGASGVEPSGGLEVVQEGPLAAVVSAVPLAEFSDERLREHLNDAEWVERVARAHEGVLERVLEKATILPLRLCTLYRDKPGVARMLREQEAALRQALAMLEGRSEWGVKLFADPDRLIETVAADAGDVDRGADDEPTGTAYLARRRRERAAGEQASELGDAVAREVHGRLERLAHDSRTNPLQRPEVHGRDARMLLNGAYLVPSERQREFEQAVYSLREQWEPRGFELELTGPWPPYNFVSTTAMVMP